MPDPETIDEAIEEAAKSGIKRVRGDEAEVELHSIGDLVKAKESAANDGSKGSRKVPIRFAKISPGGAP